jgi:hypothetical protein
VVLQQPRRADDADRRHDDADRFPPVPRRAPRTSAGSSPAEVVHYLRQLSAMLERVSGARRGWIEQLQPLIADAYHRDPTAIARQAAQLGREQIGLFKGTRAELGRIRPPADCVQCHAAASSWLDHHVTACERLIRLGDIRDVKHLGSAREPLEEARAAAQRIKLEYARLVSDLRRCVPRRSPSGGGWLPFNRARRVKRRVSR